MTPPALVLLLLLLAAGALTPRAAAEADAAADEEADGEGGALVQTTPRTNFLRLGRAGPGASSFLRLGRARGGATSAFMRLGRGSERNFLRFGRARQDGEEVADDGDEFARSARAGLADPLTRHDRNFIRFGRSGPAPRAAGAAPPLWAALLDPRLTVLPAPMGADEPDVDGAAGGSGRARVSTRSFLRLG